MTPFDVIALVGGVAGLLALILQFWSLAVAGRRVRVSTTYAMGLGAWHGRWYVSIEVANVGRIPATVQGVGIELLRPLPATRSGYGRLFERRFERLSIPVGLTPNIDSGPPLPSRLPDGDALTWLMLPESIADAIAAQGALPKVRAYARLATGKTARSRRKYRIDVRTILGGPAAG